MSAAAEITRLKKAALPKPEDRLVPSDEEFAAWCEHPVTRFVAACHAKAAEQQREAWSSASWGNGHADPNALIELRTRADAYMAFLETPLEAYVKIIEA